jgi:AcrR family transcriptional regulator
VTGLYAAVARQGFDQLTDRLRAERLNRPPTRGLVKQMALSYGVFGLERPHLYRVMHWPAVWARWGDVVTGSEPGQGGPVPADASWILEAGEARERAFAEFVIAVQLGQATGALRSRWSPHDGARVLTSLVDGYLYQTQVERVDASFEILRDYLDRYVKMAIDGLGQPRKKKQS